MSRFSSRLLWAASMALAAGAHARPVVIEDVSTFGTPDPAYTSFAGDVAIDGDYALALATRSLPNADDPPRPRRGQTAFLFHRVGTKWNVVRKLDEYNVLPDFQFPLGVAMRGGVAAAQIGPLDIWEFATTSAGTMGWVRRASLPADDNPGSYLDIEGTRVLNGQGACEWNGQIYEKTTDSWGIGPKLTGFRRADGCDDSFHGEAVTISGPWVALQQRKPDGQSFPSALIFQLSGGTWSP
jgi:hypothetical protein